MGVAGIVVDLDGPADLERVAEVKKAIDALPRRRPRNGRRDALAPSTPTEWPAGELDPDQDSPADERFGGDSPGVFRS